MPTEKQATKSKSKAKKAKKSQKVEKAKKSQKPKANKNDGYTISEEYSE